jgi:hypothetical protein
MVSPMDTVIDEENHELFIKNKLEVCLPRGVFSNQDTGFSSISLTDFEELVKWYPDGIDKSLTVKFLVDIANGHMEKLHELSKEFVNLRTSERHEIMVGNIANPKTFEKFCDIGDA